MISIFVAKLDFGVDNKQLRALFETYGKVNKATVAMDKETGRSRGFAFVEMENDQEGKAAIHGLDGRVINGRNIAVKKAEDRGDNRNQPKKFDGPAKPHSSSRHETQRPRTESTPKVNLGNNEYFVPPILPPLDNRKKILPKDKERKPDTETDRNKKPKMDAYKKSGKKDKFLEEEDDLELEGGLFSFDEEED
jgi:RNA recognition motif-containing protein